MAVQTIPALDDIPEYPQRKDPQDRFDTLIKEAVDGGSKAVSELNTKFIPAYNSAVPVMNWIEQNKPEILAVDDNAASALASKNAAAASAATATTKAGEASASASAALTSQNAAKASETAASSSATTATSKAAEAFASATAARTSETAAEGSATTAATKAEEAASNAASALASKNAAETSAITAITKAGEASTSAASAEAAKVAAEAARDEAQEIVGGNYALATRKISAGTGLSGGGDLTADRTLAVEFGTAAGTVCQGNDARLSDARTPEAHKVSHATGGADALTPADIGAQPAGSYQPAGDYALTSDPRLSDARTPTAHAATHKHGGTDPLGVFFFGLITPYYGELDATGKHPLVNGVANTSWHICDGTDGTPDMRDRVPLGASTTREMGSTGGEETTSPTLSSTAVLVSGITGATTLTIAQMPRHGHTINVDYLLHQDSRGVSGGAPSTNYKANTGDTGDSSSHTHPVSISTSNHTHTIPDGVSTVQPYIALHYLMYKGA